MKHILAHLWYLAATQALSAESSVSHVRSVQNPGTHQIKITYDLTSSFSTATVCVLISLDGGITYRLALDQANLMMGAVPADIGPNVPPGTGKSFTVDGGKTSALWNRLTKKLRFKVLVFDPAPEGFVLIPPGVFTMGDSIGEGDFTRERIHNVYVSGFYMTKYETTKELWDGVKTWGLANGYTDLAAGNGSVASKGKNHPVHMVSWHDAVKWCNARSQMEGLTPCYTVGNTVYRTGDSAPECNWNANGYRLPTEAEWEKAARGGLIGKRFPWGDAISHGQANYNSYNSYSYDVSPTRGPHPSFAKNPQPYSSPVGSFTANDYGVYDMAGNMREWCWDRYDAEFYLSSAATQADPIGSGQGSDRTLRGGDWGNDAENARTASRFWSNPTTASYNFGFRMVRTPP